MAPATNLAWDCATGSGQAARSLAKYFTRVVATDASAGQIAHAKKESRIEYRVANADASGLDDGSVDAVTVAQAMHWIEPASCFAEVRRVARPGGVVVVWGYGDPVLDDAALEATLHRYNRGTTESYWRPERRLLLDEYRDIAFPFREITAPRMEMEARWNLAELAGYLRTWSATAAYAEAIGRDPIVQVEADLASNWGASEERHRVRWPLFVRAGFV